MTHHRVRMGERAGRQGLLTAAGVRPAGWDFTVTSQVFPVRWLPNREVRLDQQFIMLKCLKMALHQHCLKEILKKIHLAIEALSCLRRS